MQHAWRSLGRWSTLKVEARGSILSMLAWLTCLMEIMTNLSRVE